jgi:hypothetical protein
MIDAVWKNDLRGIAIFRLGRCTSFQLANKIQFVSEFNRSHTPTVLKLKILA